MDDVEFEMAAWLIRKRTWFCFRRVMVVNKEGRRGGKGGEGKGREKVNGWNYKWHGGKCIGASIELLMSVEFWH